MNLNYSSWGSFPHEKTHSSFIMKPLVNLLTKQLGSAKSGHHRTKWPLKEEDLNEYHPEMRTIPVEGGLMQQM